MAAKNAIVKATFYFYSSRVCQKHSKVEWLWSLLQLSVTCFWLFFGLDSAQRLVIAFLQVSLWSSKQNKNITSIFSVTLIFVNKNRGSAHIQGATNITCSTVVFIFDESGLSWPVSSDMVGHKSGKSTPRIISWFTT